MEGREAAADRKVKVWKKERSEGAATKFRHEELCGARQMTGAGAEGVG